MYSIMLTMIEDKQLIVGICGYKGAGKTTIAKMLEAQLLRSACRYPLASRIKAMLTCGLGLTNEQVNGGQKEVPCELLGGKTPRWAMQSLGTEWGRELIHPELWLRSWRLNLPGPRCAQVIVVDDVRFCNEAAFLCGLPPEQFDVVFWRVLHPTVGPAPGEQLHPSEASALDIEVHQEIVNDGTLDQLDAKVREAVENWKK